MRRKLILISKKGFPTVRQRELEQVLLAAGLELDVEHGLGDVDPGVPLIYGVRL